MAAADVNSTYGAMLIGLLFATFFQGVLSVQAYSYYESFPNDPWKTKSLVAVVWLLDFLHLVLIAQATYYYLVSSWGDLSVLPFSTWELDSHLVLLGLATIACQSFFLHRIYIFSNRNKILLVALAAVCLATFGIDITMSIQNIRHPSVTEFDIVKPEVIAVFSIGAGSDVVIALFLCFYLQRGRSGFEKTNSIITVLLRYTVTTGLATSLLAVGCLIAYFASPHTLIFIAMHFSLGRMYTNALLATLNSRRSFHKHNTSEYSDTPRVLAKPRNSGFRPNYKMNSTTSKTATVQIEVEQTFQESTSPEYSPPHLKNESAIELDPMRSKYKATWEA